MEKDKKLKILLAALIGIAIFVWGRAFQGPGSEHNVRGNKGNPVVHSDNGKSVPLFSASSQRRKRTKTSYKNWGRNPFVLPPKIVIEEAKKIILQGILTDKKNPRALINDNTVEKGDKVGKYTVVDIKQDKVILNDGAKDVELIFKE